MAWKIIMKSYKQIVKENLLEREEGFKEALKKIRKARKELEKDKPLLFSAKIYSLWADYGEVPVTVSDEKSIDSALKKACEKFKEVNNRSDVQGNPSVWATLGEVIVSIPEKRWVKQYEKYCKYKNKASKYNMGYPKR